MMRFLFIAQILVFITSSFLMAQVSPKRGMAYGYHSVQDLDAVKTGVSWWYNWSATPDAAIASYYSSQGVEFVPMLWNDNYTAANIIANMPAGAKYILAFNEPNFTVESNMTPAQAAAAWPKIEQIAAAKNLKIVSAAPAYCGGGVCLPGYTDPVKWHDDFFAACPTCKVDYIAFHNYEPTVGGLLALTNYLKKYNLPIWVTEFAYWDPTANNADKTTYLQQAVSAFENDPDIYRYSWFTGRSTPNPSVSILGANGTLTSLGSAYINAAYGPKNNIPGKIEVEKVYRRKATGLQATTDDGGGQNVGYTDPGTWNEYLVNIATTGSYTFKFRVASNVTGGSFSVKLDETIVKNNVTIPNTGGWQTWVDYDVTGIVLPAGEHLLKFDFTATGTNMNYFTTIFESTVPPSADFTATPLLTCVGNQVVYTDLTTNKISGETYAWNFGANATPATATGIGPHTVTYSAGGQKTASLTVTNANGPDTKTKNNYVTVATPPTGCLFSDDYNNSTVNWINPIPGAFSHAESGTNWTVSNAGYGEWQNFTYTLNNGTVATPLNFACAANKPIVKIRARASANCLLSLTMLDANGRSIDNTIVTNLELTTAYQTFTIDFSKKFQNFNGGNPGMLDSSNIDRLQFAVNPGYYSYPITGVNGTYNSAFAGTLDIDWIGVGSNCNVPVSPPTITGFTPVCGSAATSVTLTGTNLTGATAVLFNGVAGTIISNTPTQIVATAPAGVTAGLIIVQTPNGNVNTASNFNMFPLQPSIITAGTASPCPSSIGNTYSVNNVVGVSYAWDYSGTGASITAGTGTNAITVTYASAINGTWTVTPSNTCGNGTVRTLGVVLGAAPAVPVAIAGTTTLSQNTTGNAFSIAAVVGATSYNWTYSGTGGTINGSGLAVTLDLSTNATGGNLRVSATNACGTSTLRSIGITVNNASVTPQPGDFTASVANVCQAQQSVVYSIPNVLGTTYTWTYSGNDVLINGSGNSVTVDFGMMSTSGILSVVANNGDGNSASRSMYITVHANAEQPSVITGLSSVSAGQSNVAYAVLNQTGVTFNWTYTGEGAAVVSGQGTNVVSIDYSSLSTAGNLKVTATGTACGASFPSILPINVLPTLGVEDRGSIHQSVNVYPNPAANFINVEFSLNTKEHVDLGIYDLLGTEVKSLLKNEALTSDKYMFSIEDLSYGIYFVKVKSGIETKIVKLIKH